MFRAIIRNGGFAAAQSELNTSLANISLQIKQLEDQLGVRLCERGHRGFRVTPQGALLAKAADKLLAEVERFRSDVNGIANPTTLTLRLGVVEHAIQNPECRIAHAIRKVMNTLPGLAVDVVGGSASDLEAQLVDGVLDMAVTWSPHDASLFECTPLFFEHFDLCCSTGHGLFAMTDGPVDLEEIKQSRHASWSSLAPYITLSAAREPASNVTGASVEAVACLVLSGHHIGYLPRGFAEPWIAKGELRSLRGPSADLQLQVSLVLRQSAAASSNSAAAQSLRKALIEVHEVSRKDTEKDSLGVGAS